jgi:opacity protein-like surface antigen
MKHFTGTAITSARLPCNGPRAWKKVCFYEHISLEPSWFLRTILPVPLRTTGCYQKAGDASRCLYSDGGFLAKKITRIVPGQSIEFDVTEQSIRYCHRIILKGGTIEVTAHTDGTSSVRMITRYELRLPAAAIVRFFVGIGIKAMHRIVARDMQYRLASPAAVGDAARGHAFIAPLLLVALMSFTHRTLAADAGFYVAAGAGKPWQHVDGSGVRVGLAFEPPTLVRPTSVDVGDSNIVWNAALGYRVNRYFAAEVAYLHYGSTDVTETYNLSLGGGIPSFIFTRTYSLQIEGPTLSVLGRLPIGQQFALFARGGVFFADEKVTERDPIGDSITLGKKVWLASAGAEWSFAPSWALRLEYAQSDRMSGDSIAGRADVRHLALDALYSW